MTSSLICCEQREAVPGDDDVFEGRDRTTGELKWTGTSVDLIFG